MLTLKVNVRVNPQGMRNLRRLLVSLRDNRAELTLDEAKRGCPVDTGALRESGVMEARHDAAHVIFGESNAVAAKKHRISYAQRPKSRITGLDRGPEFYALWVEKGTRHMRGQWFMTRALLRVFQMPMPTEQELRSHQSY
jgi:hypothetical protein